MCLKTIVYKTLFVFLLWCYLVVSRLVIMLVTKTAYLMSGGTLKAHAL